MRLAKAITHNTLQPTTAGLTRCGPTGCLLINDARWVNYRTVMDLTQTLLPQSQAGERLIRMASA